MSIIKKMATAGAVAVVGLGLGAASSSAAFSISGGAYVGAPAAAASEHSFTVAGAYTITCPKSSTTFTGNATGAASTSFTPAYGSGTVCEFFGFPASVAQSGTWSVTATGKTGSTYTGQIGIPSGSVTTINVPIASCTATVGGPQTFTHGSGGSTGTAVNVTGGVNLTAVANNVAIASASGGCPFTTSDTAVYNTNGAVYIPGITVAGP
jgi:hypothetical protein